MTRSLLLTITILAVGCMTAAPAMAQFGQGNSSNNLFQQYDIAGVGMYPAPHYSPQLGAQSYYTYQPLMPHEMTYQHSRNYYNYYNTGGYFGGNNSLNKTSVRWQSGTNHMGPLPFSRGLEPLRYKINSRIYCLEDGSGRCGLLGGAGGIGGGHFRGGGPGPLRGHFQGASLLGGGCLSGRCGSGDVIDGGIVDGGIVDGGIVDEGFIGEAIVTDGACSGGGCASRLRSALRR